MRAFFYFSAFLAAGVQFIASAQTLRRGRKAIPLGISLILTIGMYYITTSSGAGAGTFPFPSGFGVYIFLLMCTIGIAVGHVSWLCWYAAFHKTILSRQGRIASYVLFITLQFITTICIYWITE